MTASTAINRREAWQDTPGPNIADDLGHPLGCDQEVVPCPVNESDASGTRASSGSSPSTARIRFLWQLSRP